MTMLRSLQVLLLLTAVLSVHAEDAVAAPGALYDKVIAAKTVRIGVSPDSPPFGIRRGKNYQGFDIDIADAVFHGLGIDTIEYVPVTSEQRIQFLREGKVDVVVASMTQTRARESQVDFTLPYFQDGESLLVTNDSPVKTYQDLAGVQVGVEAGTTAITYLKQVAPDAKLVEYPDSNALRKALEDGTETVVSTDLLLLIGMRKLCKTPSAYRIAGQRFTTEPYAMAVPQDQSKWRNAINHALLEIWEDGTWQKCAATWFGPGAPYEHRITFAMVPYPK